MFRTVLLVAAISMVSFPAFAQDVNEIEGHYSGSGEGDLTLDLTHLENDR